MRAINLGYQFYLGTELSVGEKFDDLVFHYRDKSDAKSTDRDDKMQQHSRQQYLQAKLRLSKNDKKKKISEKQLFDENKPDFHLLKYFRSYVKIRSRGNEIEHCIICTNVDFSHQNLENKGIALLGIRKKDWPKMLDCTADKPEQACYKLKAINICEKVLLKKKSIMRTWINEFGEDYDKILNFFINCTDKEIKGSFNSRVSFLKSNKQIKQSKRKQQDSFKECKSGEDIKHFFLNDKDEDVIKIIFKELFEAFLNKLIFAVKTPNEDELDPILTKEIGKHFNLTNVALPTSYIMNEMVNWFKKTDQTNNWLTPEKAKETLTGKADEVMFLSHTTSISIYYQNQLSTNLEFNDTAIIKLKDVLKLFWENPKEKIKHINSVTPKLTAVKVISAIKKLTDFSNKDDYLVISTEHLEEDREQLKRTRKVDNCLHLIVIVKEDETKPPLHDNQYWENLISENGKRKIIWISSQSFKKEGQLEDRITIGDLSDTTKEFIKSKGISFQGTIQTVNDLIDLDEAIDSHSIEKLLRISDNEMIEIPSFSSSYFEQLLYKERQVAFPSQKELVKELATQTKCSVEKLIKDKCNVDSNGRIEWHSQDDEEKEKMWRDMVVILKEKNASKRTLLDTVPEEILINPSNKKRVIIVGVAGSGKSTLLSHYYKEIKKTNAVCWVIKINLVDHASTLDKNDFKDQDSVFNFFINCNATGIDKSPFARSLLKYRLETGDKIALMLDGFDEISSDCQDRVVQLVKNVNESIPLYITTRSHMADKLQFQLSQLAYRLVKFTEKDQIDYLTSIWKRYLKKEEIVYEEEVIQSFAEDLIGKVSRSLQDSEKDFIGIPLQCRILAECFQSKIKEEIEKQQKNKIEGNAAPSSIFTNLLEDQKFDLASLYKTLFERKRQVFLDEKIKDKIATQTIFDDSDKNHFNYEIESHLRDLAIKTILPEKKIHIFILRARNSKAERAKKENYLNERGIRFGLLDKRDQNNVQFLHRTYAEYLVADFIYNGFLLDDEQHNKLLDDESVRKWIIKDMLKKEEYNGVRVFFDSLLKEIVHDSGEWKCRIKERKVPDRLIQFARLLSDPSQEKILDGVLMRSLLSANTLHFIFDCFDIIPPTLEIEDIVWSEAFGCQRNDAYERVVRYLYDTKGNQFYKILFHLCAHPWSPWTKNREEKETLRSNLKYLLELLLSHLEHNQEIKPEIMNLHYMARFFIYSDSDDVSRSFFKLSIYYSDADFTILMRNEIIKYFKDNDWTSGHIKQTLDNLLKLDKNNVLIGLSRLILIKEPETFILFYDPLRPKDETDETRLLSNRDCYDMTHLHRAALYDHHEIFQNLLALSDSEETRKIYVLLINTNDGFSPFYVAAACGYQNICQQIINFLNKFPDFNDRIRDGMANENGFFNRPLLDSIEVNQRKMTQTILESVKNDLSRVQFNDWVFRNDETKKLIPLIESDLLKEMFDAAGGFRNWMDRLMGIGLNSAFSEVLSSEHLLHQLAKLDLLPPLVDILISSLPTNKEGKLISYWYQFIDGRSWELTIFLKRVSKCFDENELERLLLPCDPNNIHFQPLVMWGQRHANLEFLPEKLQNEIHELLRKQTPRLIDYFLQNEFDLANCTYPIRLFYNIKFCLENGNEDQFKTLSHYLSVDMLKPKLLDLQYVWKEITALFSKKLSNSNRTEPHYEGFNNIFMDFKREIQRLEKETKKRFPFQPMRIT